MGSDQFQQIIRKARSEGYLQEEDTSVVFYDLTKLSRTLDKLRTAFPDNFRHTVAVKTNSLRQVLSYIGAQGIGHEAASEGEVMKAAQASDAWVVFDGPAKTRSGLQKIVPFQERMLVNANSFHDLQKILEFPFDHIGLRVNTQVSTDVAARFDVSHKNSKFGVPLSDKRSIIDAYVQHPRLNALHFHLGSGMKAIDPFKKALALVSGLLDEIRRARKEAGITQEIEFLDIGGGLLAEEESDTYDRLEALGALMQDEFSDLCEQYTMITEFGQYIHTHNSFLYTEVADIIDHTDPATLILHQGANMFVRQAYTDQAAPFRYHILERPDAKLEQHYDLAGPLCFSGDYIEKNVSLPKIDLHEHLIIDHIGANTYSLWSEHCSFPFPKVIGFEGWKIQWVIEREAWGQTH